MKMNLVLVGRSQGRRRVLWGNVLLVSLALGTFSMVVATIAYYALAGTMSLPVAMIGFFGPAITIGAGIVQGLQSPLDRLTPLG